MTLTREAIFNNSVHLQVRPVPVPEWCPEGQVFVRMLSGHEADAIHNLLAPAKDKDNPQREGQSMASIVVLTCCDEQGRRLFQDDDLPVVQGLALAALMRVATAALDFNGMSKAAEEGLEKN